MPSVTFLAPHHQSSRLSGPPDTHPTCQDQSFQTKVERMVNKGCRGAVGRAEGQPGMQGSGAWGEGGVGGRGWPGLVVLEIPRERSSLHMAGVLGFETLHIF